MTRIEKSIEIDASPENVWLAVSPENMPQWFEQFRKVDWTSMETHKKGSTFHVDSIIAGEKSDFDAEMIEVEDNRKGIWKTTSGSINGVAEADLIPTESGTKLSMSIDYKLPYSVIGKMLDKIRVHKELDKDFDVGLKDLKYILEK